MNIVPLLTVYFLNSQSQFLDRDTNKEMASSLLYVTDKFFKPRSSSFVFVLSCQHRSTMNFYNDLVEALFRSWDDIKVQIMVNDDIVGQAPAGERMYNLLLIDSFASFLKLDPASKVRDYDTNEFYYIFLQNRDEVLNEEIQKILDYCWRHFIINVNIQVQRASGDIVVFSYFPFTASHCGEVVPVEVNRFVNGTMRNKELFPSKMANLHHCPIRVVTWNAPPYLTLEPTKTGFDSIGGFEGKLLRQLSRTMNFEIVVISPPNNEERGTIAGNRSTGAIGMLQDRKADITLGYFWLTGDRAQLATASVSHFQSSTVVSLLSVTSNYELIHSLWFPFKDWSFSALLTAFFTTLGVFFILSRLHRASEAFSRNLGLNHFASTLGLSFPREPRHDWARIFVMSWMFFGLIIRTHYGAVLFYIMTNNLFRKAPSTLEETVRLNYTVALTSVPFNTLRKTSVFTETGLAHVVVPKVPGLGYGAFSYVDEHPNQRLMTISPLETVVQYVAKYRKPGLFKVLKETVMVQNSCMYFTKHSFMVDHVNVLLLRIISVGLTDAWMRQYFDSSYFIEDHVPQEITISLNELRGVFYVCGVMLGVAFMVFCLEVISLWSQLFSDSIEKFYCKLRRNTKIQ